MTAVIDSHEKFAAAISALHDSDPAGNVFIVAMTGDDPAVILGTMRYRMPDPPDAARIIHIGGHALATFHCSPWTLAAVAVVVAFGPAHVADPVGETMQAALEAKGIEVHDVVRVQDGRCWSYLCDEHRAGPGMLLDPLDDAVVELVTDVTAMTGRAYGVGDHVEYTSFAPGGWSTAEVVRYAPQVEQDIPGDLLLYVRTDGTPRGAPFPVRESQLRPRITTTNRRTP